ncbi:MAG: Maf family protein, partial [Dehalococcoidales bacterium]|nr:Maf family protein [Dehalococcoidales bacterium]
MLRDVGVPFEVVPTDAEELTAGSSAVELAEKNAAAKVLQARLPAEAVPGAFVLGTDTVVTVDGAILGKPGSAKEAAEMLARLSGRRHRVISGVALRRLPAGSLLTEELHLRVASAITGVTFLPLDREQIEAYVASGEWRDKAGGYAVQGLAALFVSEVHGEYSNVVGLPLCLV